MQLRRKFQIGEQIVHQLLVINQDQLQKFLQNDITKLCNELCIYTKLCYAIVSDTVT